MTTLALDIDALRYDDAGLVTWAADYLNERLTAPGNYLGLAPEMVDRVLASHPR